MLKTYKQQFAKILSKHFTDLDESKILSMIEIVPDNIEWDFWFPCFQFAKTLKKSPNQIASDFITSIVESFSWNNDFDIIAVGPYINFIIPTSTLLESFFEKIFKEKDIFWKSEIGKWKTILIESPGPNTNKPLHLWHVRNMLLGNALAEIMKFAWYDVKKVDIINDRWIHICKSMLAYQRFWQWKTPESENKKSDHFVGDYYVEYSKQLKDHPEMEEEIKEMLLKWEDWDEEVRKLRTKMNKRAIDGIQQTYQRYGCHIDKAYYESEHYLSGKDIVLKWLKDGIFSKDDKWNIVFKYENKKWKEMTKVVLRADWTSVYATQDIWLAKKRFNDFQMKKMVYVVANEQEDHFSALFKILETLKYPFAKNCYHMSYGMISLPSGKMKSREWTVVDADNLIDEMVEKALILLEQRGESGSKNGKEGKAEAIAMWAIKFFILKYWVKKDFVFNPEESLSFEWETWPYLQYTYARCNSIINKSDLIDTIKKSYSLPKSKKIIISKKKGYAPKRGFAPDWYKEVIILLSNFWQIVEESAETYKPDLIAKYLFQLAQTFNWYYAKNKILTDNKEQTYIQVSLVFWVMQVIENWLKLLGIKPVKKM